MTSEKQIFANRANSLKSIGPRTLEGKQIASRNAITHGFLSGRVLIKGERSEEFDSFRTNLLCDLDPVGQIEVLLAERIIAFFWRLGRAGRMEQGLLDILHENPEKAAGGNKNEIPMKVVIHKTYAEPADDPEYEEFLKYKEQIGSIRESTPLNEPLQSALMLPSQFKQDPAIQLVSTVPQTPSPADPHKTEEDNQEILGRIVRNDFSGQGLIERLLRYEGQIERCLYRALAELQKIQYIRKRNESILVRSDESDRSSS